MNGVNRLSLSICRTFYESVFTDSDVPLPSAYAFYFPRSMIVHPSDVNIGHLLAAIYE